MNTVRDYYLSFYGASGDYSVHMPAGAKVLKASQRERDICIWALVDEGEPFELRHFSVYATGSFMADEPGPYVGTVIDKENMYDVYHVFEKAQP